MVDEVYTFDDEDGTACHLLQQVRAHYPDARIIFANGGDRTRTKHSRNDSAGILNLCLVWAAKTSQLQFMDTGRVESS
jgi:hypothetical protein